MSRQIPTSRAAAALWAARGGGGDRWRHCLVVLMEGRGGGKAGRAPASPSRGRAGAWCARARGGRSCGGGASAPSRRDLRSGYTARRSPGPPSGSCRCGYRFVVPDGARPAAEAVLAPWQEGRRDLRCREAARPRPQRLLLSSRRRRSRRARRATVAGTAAAAGEPGRRRSAPGALRRQLLRLCGCCWRRRLLRRWGRGHCPHSQAAAPPAATTAAPTDARWRASAPPSAPPPPRSRCCG